MKYTLFCVCVCGGGGAEIVQYVSKMQRISSSPYQIKHVTWALVLPPSSTYKRAKVKGLPRTTRPVQPICSGRSVSGQHTAYPDVFRFPAALHATDEQNVKSFPVIYFSPSPYHSTLHSLPDTENQEYPINNQAKFWGENRALTVSNNTALKNMSTCQEKLLRAEVILQTPCRFQYDVETCEPPEKNR
jgi:hypothetical protein